ncbi:MAG: SDR family NAD(P)-dependent oxidoreductase, partial [Terriglobia bacterium]
MNNILITGGAGFIGSHLAQRLLREGKCLAIVDNLDDYYPAELKRANLEEVKASGEFQFFPTDIRDGEKLREVFSTFKPEAVIHLAARPGVRLSFAQPEAYTSINVLGTTQVLEISRLSGVRRIVFASSSSVYGHSSRAPFREDATISHPLSIYAATKVAGEAVAFTYSHAYALSVVCLRLFTVYGPRQRPDLAIRKFAG